ncbi:MAG: PAS domain S-box protein [Deltaproteobacteria bacterium]|nr:PAS domain S-box protein [Deltaproteobacteria bacterium]
METSRILHVEDDAIDADWFARVVERMASERTPRGSLEIIHCKRLGEALECLRFATVSVIVLDVCLPDATPAQAVAQVKSAAPGIPVIVLSGRSYAEMCGAGLARELYGFVSKSDASPVFLGEVLRNTLDLSQAQAQLRSVIHRSADGMVVIDANGVVRFANPAAAEMFGRSLDELRGQPFGAPVVTGDSAEVQVGLDRIAEMRVVDIDWEGRPARLASLRDVTERRRAEAALRTSEERLRAMSDSAPDAMVTFDARGHIVGWNPAAERIFGHPTPAALGLTVRALVAGADDRQRFQLASARAAVTTFGGGEPATLVLRGLRGDSRDFPMEVQLAHWQAADGAFTTAFFRDITEREQLELKLASTQKMDAMGRLAGGVAHDFNNLLTAILGHTEMMLQELPEPSSLREHVADVREAGLRAAQLTHQLLAFSRRQPTSPRPLDLGQTVSGMQRMLQHIIGEDITIEAACMPDLWAVRADPSQIEQVILNLVVNAKDAMPHGGTLRIELTNVELDSAAVAAFPNAEPGSFVRLSVIDHGCGMDRATQARIFEPFFTTKPEGHGTGLGLATVYGIVEQSRGHIEVESELGRGTSFRVYLPRIREAGVEPSPAAPVREDVGGSETVLLVEDDEVVRRVARQGLEAHGYRVLACESAGEALERMASESAPIDLLITDVVMPEMNGCDLATLVSKRQPGIRVLFISGYTGEAMLRYGVVDQSAAFLAKPFGPLTLVRRARELLDARVELVATRPREERD